RPIVPGATGGRLAAPVWGRVMRQLPAAAGPEWRPPPGVETRYVDASGAIVGPGCWANGAVRAEYFLAGTAPPGRCGRILVPATPDSALEDSLLGEEYVPWWRAPADSQPWRRGVPGREEADPDSGVRADTAGADSAAARRDGDRGGERRPPAREERDEEARGRRPPRLLGRPGPPLRPPGRDRR